MARSSLVSLVTIVVAVGGCGDDGVGSSDASMVGDGAVMPVVVEPPALPEAPRLDPCPEGWPSVSRGGVSTCAPWADGLTADACGAGEALFVGEGCARIGPPCGAGRFAEDLPSMNVIYVDGEAAAPGDGSASAPFTALEDAVSAASSGDVIALSKGTHEAALIRPRAGVTFAGACVEETIVRAPGPDPTGATIVVSAAGVTLRNLTITGPRVGVLSTADAELVSVLVDRPTSGGVVTQASVTGERVVVRDVVPAAGSSGGEGIVALRGGRVTLTSVVLERTQALGVLGLSAETDISLSRVRIADVGGLGRGIELQMGAGATLTDVAMDTEGVYGYATEGSNLTLSRAHLRGGATIEVNEGSTLTVRQADLDQTYASGIAVFDATAVVEDSLITATTADIAGDTGYAIYAEGSDLRVDRTKLAEGHTVGVYLVGGTATLHDLEVVDTQHGETSGLFGHGLQAVEGAEVTLRRVLLARNGEAGMTVAHAGTRVDAEDLRIEETRSREADGLHGVGLAIFGNARLTGSRVALARNRQTGIGALMGGSVTLTDVEVSETLERACASGACSGLGFGSGVVADDGGAVSLSNFIVRGSALCGVRVLESGAVDLADGTVANNPIGANIQDADFDVDRLSQRVLYDENGRNLARDDLPPPGLPTDVSAPGP